MLPLASCPPLSMRGFLRRGGGVGASPCSQLGKGVELSDAVSAGAALGFFGNPRPIILPPRTCSMQLHGLLHRHLPSVVASTVPSSLAHCTHSPLSRSARS